MIKFCNYIQYRTKNWYFEYALFTKFERALLNIDFNLPVGRDKSFCLGFTIFTLTLFFFEIAYIKDKK